MRALCEIGAGTQLPCAGLTGVTPTCGHWRLMGGHWLEATEQRTGGADSYHGTSTGHALHPSCPPPSATEVDKAPPTRDREKGAACFTLDHNCMWGGLHPLLEGPRSSKNQAVWQLGRGCPFLAPVGG